MERGGFSALCLWTILCVCGAQQDAHLIVLSTGAHNTAALAVVGQHRSNSHIYPFANGTRVSSACPAMGNTFRRRCRDLSAVSAGQNHIILAPLQNAVGLMELRHNGTELSKVSDYVLSITSEALVDNCTPLDIVHFEGTLMVLCLENFQVIRSCNINLDHSNISRSTLSCVRYGALQRVTDYNSISNFVMYEDQHQVLFTVGRNVYGVRIDRHTVQPYYPLDDGSCNNLHFVRDHMFYAYCASGGARVYDTDQEQCNTIMEMPYPCSSASAGTPLFRVEQTVQDTVVHYDDMAYRTSGLNFTEGECYDVDTFFLLDSLEGTKLFRQSSGTFQLLSNSSRDRNLAVFHGPHVVVYRTVPGELLLYNPSFQEVVRKSLEMPVAVGVVTNMLIVPQTSSTPTTTLTTTQMVTLTTTLTTMPMTTPTIPTLTPMASTTPMMPTPASTIDFSITMSSTTTSFVPAILEPTLSSSSVPKLLGSVVGVVFIAAVVLIILAVCCWYNRRRRRVKQKPELPGLNEEAGVVLSLNYTNSSSSMESSSSSSLKDEHPLPLDAQNSANGGEQLVSANESLLSSNHFSPQMVAEKCNEKTNTEEKRNDLNEKVHACR